MRYCSKARTVQQNALLFGFDEHLVLPVQVVGKLYKVDDPVVVDVTKLHQAIQSVSADAHLVLIAHSLQVLCAHQPFAILHIHHQTHTHTLSTSAARLVDILKNVPLQLQWALDFLLGKNGFGFTKYY